MGRKLVAYFKESKIIFGNETERAKNRENVKQVFVIFLEESGLGRLKY